LIDKEDYERTLRFWKEAGWEEEEEVSHFKSCQFADGCETCAMLYSFALPREEYRPIGWLQLKYYLVLRALRKWGVIRPLQVPDVEIVTVAGIPEVKIIRR